MTDPTTRKDTDQKDEKDTRPSNANRRNFYLDDDYFGKLSSLAQRMGLAANNKSKGSDRLKSAVIRAGLDCLEERYPDQSRIHRHGFSDMLYPANGHDYTKVLREAQQLTLVFNDMHNWLKNHSHRQALQDRIRKKQQTLILLCHPNSPYRDILASVSKKTKAQQRKDIEDSVKLLLNGLTGDLSSLSIYGHRRFNTFSGAITEAIVMANYYPVEKRYNDGFIHIYRDTTDPNNIFRQFVDDATELVRDCKAKVRNYDLIKMFTKPSAASRRQPTSPKKSKKSSR